MYSKAPSLIVSYAELYRAEAQKEKTMKFKKQELIDALEAKRKDFVKADKAAKVKHQKEEREALVQYRRELRAAVKLSYEELQKSKLRALTLKWLSCPISLVSKLDYTLEHIKLSQQKSYTLGSYSSNFAARDAYALLTFDIKPAKGLC